MNRKGQRIVWRLCGALVLLCLLLPLIICLCEHGECADEPVCSCTDCLCICHAVAVVIPAAAALAPCTAMLRALPPAAWSCPQAISPAIFRPPIV